MTNNQTFTEDFRLHVIPVQNIITGEHLLRVDRGAEPLFTARQTSYEFFCENKKRNRDFRFCAVITSAKNEKYIWWKDTEIEHNYLTPMPEGVERI